MSRDDAIAVQRHGGKVIALRTCYRFAAFALVVLGGCANSGVVPMGQDTYMVAANEWGFTSGAVHKARLLQQASDFCQSLGKTMEPIRTRQNDVALGKTPGAEVQFRCLAVGSMKPQGTPPQPAE